MILYWYKNNAVWTTGKMVQQLKVVTTLPENPSSVPRTHFGLRMVVPVSEAQWCLLLASMGTKYTYFCCYSIIVTSLSAWATVKYGKRHTQHKTIYKFLLRAWFSGVKQCFGFWNSVLKDFCGLWHSLVGGTRISQRPSESPGVYIVIHHGSKITIKDFCVRHGISDVSLFW